MVQVPRWPPYLKLTLSGTYTDQYQYCNAKGQCGDLASFADAFTSAASFFDMTSETLWDG